MEEINLDLEKDLHNTMGVSLSNQNPSSSNMDFTISRDGPKETNIGLELLVNKKKITNEPMPLSGMDNSAPLNFAPPSIYNDRPTVTSSATPNISSVDLSTPQAQTPPISTSNEPEVIDLDKLLGDDNDISNSNVNLDNSSNNMFSINNQQSAGTSEQPNYFSEPLPRPKTFEEIQKEKAELLRLFDRLEAKGVRLDKKFTMESDLNEMQSEYERIVQRRAVDQSIRFQRKMLIAFVTAMEFLNNKFDPFNLKLDGWSESIHENQHDYDDVFEELHEKYKGKANMAPEIKLLFMLGGSAAMVHMTNTMFKSSMPGMDDILKQNPDLMQQFTQAAVNTMGEQNPGFGNFMNMSMGPDIQPPRGAPPGPPEQYKREPPRMPGGFNTGRPDIGMSRGQPDFRDAENMESSFSNFPTNSKPSRRPEMKGPKDLKDILSGLKTKTIKVDNNPESVASIA